MSRPSSPSPGTDGAGDGKHPVAVNRSWRVFRRMQLTVLAVACLLYAAGLVQAWGAPTAPAGVVVARTVLVPGGLMVLTLAAALFIPLLRAALLRHLLISYRTGFGQSVISVLGGVGAPIALAGVIFWQLNQAPRGGAYPGGAFSGFAAVIGVLIAQSLLLRRMETDPALRREIEG